jgi:hypothetical protein
MIPAKGDVRRDVGLQITGWITMMKRALRIALLTAAAALTPDGIFAQAPAPGSNVKPPVLTLALTLRVQVGAPVELGNVPRGRTGIQG